MEPIGVTPGIHSTISYHQMKNIPGEVEDLHKREKSDKKQWKIHCTALFIVSVSQLVNLIRGSPRRESIIGIEKCGKVDWLILINYCLFIICMTTYAVIKVKKE